MCMLEWRKAELSRCGWILACGLICVSASPAKADTVLHLALQSELGDYIGGGVPHEVVFDSPTDTVWARIMDQLSSGEIAGLFFYGINPSTYTSQSFSMLQPGIPIQPGTYPDATLWPFESPGQPGTSAYFDR